jgi:hypothetical protein
MRLRPAAAASAILFIAGAPGVTGAQDAANMTFFVSSVGSGDGANLGGLEGADALCTRLAEAAGAGGKEWRAYLSATGVHARDRIGPGPWQNYMGQPIALNVANLHSDSDNFTKFTALTETGEMVPGFGDATNTHDILTGSNDDGTLAEGMTCNDWTSNGEGTAMVGHSDEGGPPQFEGVESWNSAHQTQGCGQEALVGTGGAGQIYCFAVTAP